MFSNKLSNPPVPAPSIYTIRTITETTSAIEEMTIPAMARPLLHKAQEIIPRISPQKARIIGYAGSQQVPSADKANRKLKILKIRLATFLPLLTVFFAG